MRLIENLASNNNTKNIDFEMRNLAIAFWNEQMDDVKSKLDIFHKLLKKQVNFVEDVKAIHVDNYRAEEEDVNFINGTCFQN